MLNMCAPVGDTVELHLTNDKSSTLPHSIDLHAVTGPGGGAGATQVAPGETKQFTFKAVNPGVFVYHCATPHIPTHLANGMYGLIVVEPEQGLQPVDRRKYAKRFCDLYYSMVLFSMLLFPRATDGGHNAPLAGRRAFE